jgi:hypothetical protein
MPVEGLPNPHIHRNCKHCGKWFHPEEGSVIRPPATGVMAAIRASASRMADDSTLFRFYCFACQTRQRKLARSFWMSMAALAVFAVVGYFAAEYFGLWDALKKRR